MKKGRTKVAKCVVKIANMSVKEIEQAIKELPRHEITELSQWFEEFQNQIWDEQIVRDAKTERFDELIEQAKASRAVGETAT